VTATHLRFWEYDRHAVLTCPGCAWTGCGADNEETFSELLDVRCPKCDRMLLIVAYATADETRAAAAAGNERAVAALQSIDEQESRVRRAESRELKEASQLPDLIGVEVRIEWDFEERGGEKWTVLRHEGSEIWRELAFWEGYERFAEVFKLVRERYGARLVEVRPTVASELYLYGDRLSAPKRIKELNESLRA
jgi:hypothetical protein